jgi:hypothetical protein
MLLKFNFDGVYNGELLFEKGKTYDVSEENGFASRWIRRGAEQVKKGITDQSVDSAEESKQDSKVNKVYPVAKRRKKDVIDL